MTMESLKVGGVVMKTVKSRRKSGPNTITVVAKIVRVQKNRVVAEALEDYPAAGIKHGQQMVIVEKDIAGYRPEEVESTAEDFDKAA